MLLKLATECTYTFNHRFYKKIDGCTVGGPLSELKVRVLFLKNLCFIAVTLMTSTMEKNCFKYDRLFEKLNNYYPNIKPTIEVSTTKFWTQVYILTMVSTTLQFIGKQQNNLHIGHRKFLKGTNAI